MIKRHARRSFVALLAIAIAIAVGLQACTYVAHPARPATQLHPPQYYDYYYYPDVDVYYHIYLGSYYYRAGRNWVKVRVLPSHIHLDHQYRVPVHVMHDTPYVKHEEHWQKYRPRVKPRMGREEDRRVRDQMERRHNSRQYEEYHRKQGDEGRPDRR